jgi:guanyl-specific ribonuclease Sa
MTRIKVFSILLALFFFAPIVGHCQERQTVSLTSFHGVADHIKKNNRLPDNFIMKNEAKKLGWNPVRGNLWDVATGKSIGGDVFLNREKKLPVKRGRSWYEADINYKGGKRGKDRIIFSSDGLIYKTEDHYKTFTRID